MAGDRSEGIADRVVSGAWRSPNLLHHQDRKFWVGLACALAVHAALIFGAIQLSPRQMGEPDGSKEGVTVDVVDAADLVSRQTEADRNTSTPTEPVQTQPQIQPQTQPQAQPQPQPQPQPQRPATPAAPPLGGEPQPHQDAPPSTDKDAATAAPLPETTTRQTERQPSSSPRPQEKQKPREPSLSLNLNMPDVSIASLDRSAAVSRPEGVTRSGENDEFGRAVIRALRQTMPNPRGMNGRVTIRLFLTESGNLLEVRIIRSGGDPILDQSVVFAVKQTSFPIPPVGSVVADRTFLVTYVYR
jgi:protein TonB